MFDDISINMMITTLLVFLCMIFLLNKILYKPLLGFMDGRERGLKEDEEECKRHEMAALKYAEQSEKLELEARSKAALIRAEALKESEAKKQELLEEIKKEYQQELSAHQALLSKEKISIKASLQDDFIELKTALKNKIKDI